MVHSSWLLRTSWIKVLKGDSSISKALHLPLSYYISTSLKFHIGVPSVAVPSSLSLIENASCLYLKQTETLLNHLDSIYPTVLEEAQLATQGSNKLAVLVDSMDHATALMPLVCRLFNNKQLSLHIVLVNGVNRLHFLSTLQTCTNQKVGMLHDLTSAYNNGVDEYKQSKLDYVVSMTHVLEVIRPQVLIHVKDDFMAQFPMVMIGLPSIEIKHALWISELTIDSLLRR
jgi:hypothetical protein